MKTKALIYAFSVACVSNIYAASDWDSAIVENFELEKVPWEEAVRSAVANAGLDPSELKIKYAPDVLTVNLDPTIKPLRREERKKLLSELQPSIRNFIQAVDYRVGINSENFGPIQIGKLPLSKVLNLLSDNAYDAESRTILIQNRLELTAVCIESNLSKTEHPEIIETVRVLLQFEFFTSDAGGFIALSTKTGDELEEFQKDRMSALYAIEKLLSDGHDRGLILNLIKHQFAWCGTGMKEIDESSPLGQMIKAFDGYRRETQPGGGINSEAAPLRDTP